MKTFKIMNLQTWEIDKVTAETEKAAQRIFKSQKNLTKFDETLYQIKEEGAKSQKQYSSLTFSQYEQKEFHNRKI